ncbi:MAG: papain-like cysteine protease family protein [Blastocatellia bacterium]
MKSTSSLNREMETGKHVPVRGRRAIKPFSGLETLNLSVPEPEPTEHLSLLRTDGADFRKRQAGPAGGSGRLLDEITDEVEFNLELADKHGVGLVLELRRVLAATKTDFPLIVNVNGDEWPAPIDPLLLSFQRFSWYLPHYLMEPGGNRITLRLSREAQTHIVLKSISVMRFEMQRQLQDKWCWAAVIASLLHFFDASQKRTQCEIVQKVFGALVDDFDETKTNCCKQGADDACNQTFKLVDALDEMDVLSTRSNYPLSVEEIREQIHAGVPVAVRIRWRGGGGHFVLITAVGPDDPRGPTHTWLRVADPADGTGSYLSYRRLRDAYQDKGHWTHTYTFERERRRRDARK